MICSCAAFTLNVCAPGGTEQLDLPVEVALSTALSSTHPSGLGQAHFQLIYWYLIFKHQLIIQPW